MMISPSKCPTCEKNTVYNGGCSNCWWIEPSVLRSQADSYEATKKYIIAVREGRIKEEIQQIISKKLYLKSTPTMIKEEK